MEDTLEAYELYNYNYTNSVLLNAKWLRISTLMTSVRSLIYRFSVVIISCTMCDRYVA